MYIKYQQQLETLMQGLAALLYSKQSGWVQESGLDSVNNKKESG